MTEIVEDHHHSDTELSAEAKELILHGDNNGHLYRTSTVPIRKNLNKKIKKGVYDHEKATKLWGYHADRAAQSYTREFGHAGQKWHEMFAPKHRKAAAKHWADEHHEAVMSGDTGHMHEDDNTAAEIVFAAMGKKPMDVTTNFKDAVLERSHELVSDMKVELAGNFMGPSVEEGNKTNYKSRGSVQRRNDRMFAMFDKAFDDKATNSGWSKNKQNKWTHPDYPDQAHTQSKDAVIHAEKNPKKGGKK